MRWRMTLLPPEVSVTMYSSSESSVDIANTPNNALSPPNTILLLFGIFSENSKSDAYRLKQHYTAIACWVCNIKKETHDIGPLQDYSYSIPPVLSFSISPLPDLDIALSYATSPEHALWLHRRLLFSVQRFFSRGFGSLAMYLYWPLLQHPLLHLR